MFQYPDERSRVTRPDVVKVARRNLAPGHISLAYVTQHRSFDERQAAWCLGRAFTGSHPGVDGSLRAPQPTGGMEQVKVRQAAVGRRHPVKQETGVDERQVERLAVIGHQRAGSAHGGGDVFE